MSEEKQKKKESNLSELKWCFSEKTCVYTHVQIFLFKFQNFQSDLLESFLEKKQSMIDVFALTLYQPVEREIRGVKGSVVYGINKALFFFKT